MLSSTLEPEQADAALRSDWRLPVLMYHHVGTDQRGVAPGLTVSPRDFVRQLDCLARWGYTPVSCATLDSARAGQCDLPSKPVILTFDDGYRDLASTVYPPLTARGWSCTTFLVTGQLGGTNAWDYPTGGAELLDAASVREWSGRGMEFGGHTISHPRLPTMSREGMAREMGESIRVVAELTGQRVVPFAYPYGARDARAREEAGRLCSIAFSVVEGINRPRTDPLDLRRTMVHAYDSDLEFRARLLWGRNPAGWFRDHIVSRIARS